MDECLFCKIIRGDIPSFKVYEDDKTLAFLTINPRREGHTLIIPKNHVDYIFDSNDQELSDLVIASKKVAEKLKTTFNPESGKIGVVVAGLEVPHAHIHLIPLDSEKDLEATPSSPTMEELTVVSEKIHNA